MMPRGGDLLGIPRVDPRLIQVPPQPVFGCAALDEGEEPAGELVKRYVFRKLEERQEGFSCDLFGDIAAADIAQGDAEDVIDVLGIDTVEPVESDH